MTDAELTRTLAAWRQQGRRSALVCGSFELLHPGHLRHLERARTLADGLLVAVIANSTGGTSHEWLIPPLERVEILESLSIVDAACVTTEENLGDIVQQMPALLLVETRLDPARSVLYEIVRKLGGEIAVLPREAEWSTSAILGKIQR